jgi:hypothetical protein
MGLEEEELPPWHPVQSAGRAPPQIGGEVLWQSVLLQLLDVVLYAPPFAKVISKYLLACSLEPGFMTVPFSVVAMWHPEQLDTPLAVCLA